MRTSLLSVVFTFIVVVAQGQYTHTYRDACGKLVTEHKVPEIKRGHTKKNPNRAMHTVTIHLNPSNAFFMVALVSEDTAFAEHSNNMVTMVVPEGDYQLCADEVPAMNPCLILANMHVYSNIDTTISRSSANLVINTDLKDEKGVILRPEESNMNMFGYMVYFGDDQYWPFTVTVAGLNITEIRTTAIPQGMKLRIGRHGGKFENNRYSGYSVNYDIIERLTQDTVISNNPEELHHFPLEFSSTPAGREFHMGWGFGSIANSTLFGKTDTFVLGFLDETCPANKKEIVEYYVNHAASDTMIAWFGSFVSHIQEDLNIGGFRLVSTGTLFLDTSDELVMSIRGSYPPVKGDYKAIPGELTKLIKGPPVHFHWGVSDPGSSIIRAYPSYKGISNERRSIDIQYSTYELWRGNEILISDSLKFFQTYTGVPAPDIYKLVFKNTNYEINGRTGKQTTELEFNLADSADANAPTPISLSVRQGNNATDEIIRGYPASVVIMAADLENLPEESVYHDLASAELFYKESSASDWLPLDLTILPEELDSLIGMPYVADLWEVLDATTDTSWIDLKLVLTDSTGNTNTQTFSPAFFIRDALVGTSESTLTSFTVYPNPADDFCFINTNCTDNDMELTLFSQTGEAILVKKLNKHTGYLNLSSYKPGVYLLRLKTEGEVYVRKLVVY